MSEQAIDDALRVNLVQAKEMILRCIKARLVPLLKGSPGCGKSAVIRQIADEYNLKLIDLRLSQCDPTDLCGFPRIDEVTGKASYAPMDTFPLVGDAVPEGYDGWLILLDELTSAPRAVQASAYKLLHEQEIGSHQLHPKVAMVGAGNLDTDNAIVEPMSTALQSRLIHMEVQLDSEAWLNWAMGAGIDHRITSYIKYKPTVLYNFDPDHTDVTYASPRTWEYVSKLIHGAPALDHTWLPLLAGTVSQGVAREFIGHTKIYEDLVTIDEVKSNPQTARIPDQPSHLFALTGAMAAHASDKTINLLMPYMGRLPKEWQVVCLREVVRRDVSLMQSAPVKEWISSNATELF